MEILDIKRGDILLINIDYDTDTKTWISRPFLVIQNDIGNKYSNTVIVIPIISSIDKPKLPTHAALPREVTGLEADSIAVTERITIYNKKRLESKIGELNINSEYMRMVEKAILISVGHLVPKGEESEFSFGNIAEDYESYIKELTKPLVITEGITDITLIKTAWQKLYPNKEMFFEFEPSGIEYEKEEREGGADRLRRTIEFLSNTTQRPIIGLFDNDREGNEQFKSLSKKIFEKYNIESSIRKHKYKNVWGMLLPVANERELFVTSDDMIQRYFVIEHYFSDEILREYSMYGKNILRTPVFQISGDKNNFSRKIQKLESKEFINFQILFNEIEKVFKSAKKE